MTTPFAHIQTRHEPSTALNKSKVALVATLSIEPIQTGRSMLTLVACRCTTIYSSGGWMNTPRKR